MNFEIRDGNERLPDEEDVYGVNDIEEQERFDSLLGIGLTQEERVAHHKARLRVIAVVVIIAFGLLFVMAGLRQLLGW